MSTSKNTAGADQGLEKADVDACRNCQHPSFGSKDQKPRLHEFILNIKPTQGKEEAKVWEPNSLGHRNGHSRYQVFCSLGEGKRKLMCVILSLWSQIQTHDNPQSGIVQQRYPVDTELPGLSLQSHLRHFLSLSY